MSRPLLLLALAACGSAPPPAAPAPAPVAPPLAPAPVAEPAPPEPDRDPYLWLEEVTGPRSTEWAAARSETARTELEAVPGFAATRDRIRTILDAKDKLPIVRHHGAYLYNLWTDAAHPRGLFRRTSPAEFRKPEPAWEVVLDLDALAAAEHESWVFGGYSCLHPTADRCLISLSRGGADATTTRELDMTTKRFVAGGFVVPEAKHQITWKDRDTVYIATDVGPGSMTASGYPRIAKEWKRGTPLAAATVVFEGQPSDMRVALKRYWDHGVAYDLVDHAISWYVHERYVRDRAGALSKLEVPVDATIEIWDGHLLVTLRSDWKRGARTWPAGALLALPLATARTAEPVQLFEPTPSRALVGTTGLRTALVVAELDDLHSKAYAWSRRGDKWSRTPLALPDELVTIEADRADGSSDELWLQQTGFLTPTTLWFGTPTRPAVVVKRGPARFDAAGLRVEQHHATSKDGTRIPYFQIGRAGLPLDGRAPTIVTGYGGFQVSKLPEYDPIIGTAWLERGGIYVVANLRGGGEFGPAWHQAARGANRQRAYDDFIAVAEDLVARKVTSTPRLGITGRSNGGLLVGVMLTQRPDLFGAITCGMPLLDMRRYHKLLAGASWIGEYGDPDQPADWAVLEKYSPYQHVRAGAKYPRTLFLSSTRDDRVHPGHARKMVARMLEQRHDVIYYENTEGGHRGDADSAQRAHMKTLELAFFAKQLGLGLQ
jgi:prolyl oligopeptidase